jgi:hypothetical protein
MNGILTAAGIGTALLALAIWIEIRERRVEPAMAATGVPVRHGVDSVCSLAQESQQRNSVPLFSHRLA